MLAEGDALLARLGPSVLPFERTGFKRRVKPGEDLLFLKSVISLEQGRIPEHCLRCKPPDVGPFPADHKYLWVIDHKGFRVIPETTLNPASERGYVCHTNITGYQKALQGGELWFGTDNVIYLNNQSGRFKANSDDQQEAVLEYVRRLGFTVVQLPNRPS